jgi:hypothetical protein
MRLEILDARDELAVGSSKSSVISRKLGLEVMGLILVVLGRWPIVYPDLAC